MTFSTASQPTSSAGIAQTAPIGASLRLVGTDPSNDHDDLARHRDRNAFRDEEHELQSQALALESHCLRRRAERYAEAIERGALVADEQVDAVQRAFRAYRPFLFADDRVQNDAARRRLAATVAGARSRRPVATTPDASVA